MKHFYLCLSVITLFLFFMSSSSIADTVFNVEAKGSNYLFGQTVPSQHISANTTIKVKTHGNAISLEIGQIQGVHNAAIYKGKRDSSTGRFAAMWWYKGAPHEARLVEGVMKDNTIKGQITYPRVSGEQVPGYLSLSFHGKSQSMVQVIPSVQAIHPQQSAPPAPVVPPVPAHVRPLFKEDCIGFNPARIAVKNIGNRWKIVEGSHYILDFGDNKAEAITAFKIIKRYGFDQSCFVGRPGPSMTYWLKNGRAVSGSMAGEDCLQHNLANLQVRKLKGSWKIVDGSHWLMDFGTKKSEAKQALQIMRQHGFSQHCFVGRPQPSFEYWKH